MAVGNIMKSNEIVLILGGSRSGKSQFAENLATSYGQRVLYLATAAIYDSEMAARVQKHRERRSNLWETREETRQLVRVIEELNSNYDVVLLDCLTLWITNLLLDEQIAWMSLQESEEHILNEINKLIEACLKKEVKIIIVSNEVGLGIVPEHQLGRQFRDIAGYANQICAKYASKVYFIAAGLPITLKS